MEKKLLKANHKHIVSESVVMKARLAGIHIKSYQLFYEEGPKSNIKKSIDTLMASGARVIFIAAEGPAQLAAMTVAAHSGYINNNTVWITTDTITSTLSAAISDFNSIVERRANNTDVIPTFYNMPTDDNGSGSLTNETKAVQRQSLLDMIDPVEYAARQVKNLTTINYEETFSGGVFMFDVLKELPGYAPFDAFLNKWSQLDPAM